MLYEIVHWNFVPVFSVFIIFKNEVRNYYLESTSVNCTRQLPSLEFWDKQINRKKVRLLNSERLVKHIGRRSKTTPNLIIFKNYNKICQTPRCYSSMIGCAERVCWTVSVFRNLLLCQHTPNWITVTSYLSSHCSLSIPPENMSFLMF